MAKPEDRVAELEKKVAALIKVLKENGISLDHHKDLK